MDALLATATAGGAGIGQWGPQVLAAVVWLAAGLALAEVTTLAFDRERRPGLWRNIRSALPWTAGLVAAQAAALGLAVVMDPDFKLLGQVAIMFTIFALLLPVIWAAGQHHAATISLPVKVHVLQRFPAWGTAAIFFVIGLGLNFITLVAADVRIGDAITDMTGGISDQEMAFVAIWLILNAPWQEELIFRHYLLPRLARPRLARPGRLGGQRKTLIATAIVLTAAIFALGHAGHTDPAWPKLAQTFGWGLLLGTARVTLGTWYAVALHLAWNITSPLFAPFIQT